MEQGRLRQVLQRGCNAARAAAAATPLWPLPRHAPHPGSSPRHRRNVCSRPFPVQFHCPVCVVPIYPLPILSARQYTVTPSSLRPVLLCGLPSTPRHALTLLYLTSSPCHSPCLSR